MRPKSFRAQIIRVLPWLAVLLLAGCSVLRTVGYSHAPNLAYWRLDSYLDFDGAQTPRVRHAIAEYFRWHRTTQLPDYVTLASRMRTQAGEPATAERACALWGEIGKRLDTALERAANDAVGIALTLTPQQVEHAERRFAKSIDELRDELLQDSPAERRRAQVKRAVERFELVYGRADDEQRKRIADGVAASPFDAERFVAERRARHQDALAVLRRLAAGGMNEAQARQAMLELAAQTQASPRADYREHQRKLIAYNCEFAAQLHNATTPKQRDTARQRLAEWEQSFVEWGADAATAAATAR